MKKTTISEQSLLFKNLFRITYFFLFFIIMFIGSKFIGYNLPVWEQIIIKGFLTLYLLLGIILTYIYRIPIFNPLLSSWLDNKYNADPLDYIGPVLFIFLIIVAPI